MAARWAEVDPAGFLQWIEANAGDFKDATRLYKSLLTLFQVWLATDEQAAFAAAERFPMQSLKGALGVFLIAALNANMDMGIQSVIRAGIYERVWIGADDWIDRDPARAAALIQSLPASQLRSELNAIAAGKIAKTDPSAAIDVLCEPGRRDRSRYHHYEYPLRQIAENALRLDVVDSISNRVIAMPTNIRYEWPQALGQALASSDPERAIAFADQSLNGPAKKNVMLSAFSNFARRDPAAAAARAEALPPGPIRDSAIEVVRASTVR